MRKCESAKVRKCESWSFRSFLRFRDLSFRRSAALHRLLPRNLRATEKSTLGHFRACRSAPQRRLQSAQADFAFFLRRTERRIYSLLQADGTLPDQILNGHNSPPERRENRRVRIVDARAERDVSAAPRRGLSLPQQRAYPLILQRRA